MEFIETIYERAKKIKKKILFPEGEELRVLNAVEFLSNRGICDPVLIGKPDKISEISKSEGLDLKDIEIIDPGCYRKLDEYIALYRQLRRHKNIGEAEARKLITGNPVFYSALAIRAGDFDGFVAGASITTRDVAKAAIYCIGTSEGIKTVSSVTVIILSDKSFGADGVFIFADAGIVPDPTPEQLQDIAITSAKMARLLLKDEPRVAMLSYSTKGSGSGKSVEKVRKATELVMQKEPELLIDGEVQIDSAIVPEVAQRKDPHSRIKGRANVLIFPNLDAGNIAYKLTERLAKGRAIGPLLQGLSKPASDLSRGCTAQGIVDAAAITALRAQEKVGF